MCLDPGRRVEFGPQVLDRAPQAAPDSFKQFDLLLLLVDWRSNEFCFSIE